MRNPEADVVDAIAALVDEQLERPYGERSGYDNNINQDSCPKCGGPWHGLVRGSCPGATGIRGTDPEPPPPSPLARLMIPATPHTWTEQRHSNPVIPSDDEPLRSEFRLVTPLESPRVEFCAPGDAPVLAMRHRVTDFRCMSSYDPGWDFVSLGIRVDDQTLTCTYPAEAIDRLAPGCRLAHTALPPFLPDSFVELFTHRSYGVVAMFRIHDGALQFRLRFPGLRR